MVDTTMSKKKHCFWIIIVTLSMITAISFLYNNTWNFVHSNVVTTVDTMTAPLTEIFFPSVVVCNINQVRDSSFETIPEQWFAGSLSQYAQMELKNISKNSESSHQLCKDMFIYSKWNGTTVFDFYHERDFGTDFGICCWFTPQLNLTQIGEDSVNEKPDWGKWFTTIKKGAKTGKDNGYTLLLDVESFDYKFSIEGSEGFKVALVHHLDMPIMRQIGFHVSPGTENQIAVTPTLMGTSPNAMARFSPEQRDCYSEDEISLKYLPRKHGYRYEMSNCLFEAAFEKILEDCHCFPGFHTKDGEQTKRLSTCQSEDKPCVNRIMNQMGQFDHVTFNGHKVKCRSNCEDQINSVLVTASAYPNRGVFVKRHEFCYVLRRLQDKCKSSKRRPLEEAFPTICAKVKAVGEHNIKQCHEDEPEWSQIRKNVSNCTYESCPVEDIVWQYARKNLAVLNVFIKEPYAKRFLKHVKTTQISFIANSGGILGLCMGFSFISAAEVIFHCIVALVPVFSGKRRRGKPQKISWKERKYSMTLETDLMASSSSQLNSNCQWNLDPPTHQRPRRQRRRRKPRQEETNGDLSLEEPLILHHSPNCPVHGDIQINHGHQAGEVLEQQPDEDQILIVNQNCHRHGGLLRRREDLHFGPERFI